MCACGGGICGAETRQYSGVREFIPPTDDLASVMTQTCEQCGITGLHICGSAFVNSYPKTDTGYSAIIEELEKSLAASEKDLEGARRGLRMMTEERDALLSKVKELIVSQPLKSIDHQWDGDGDHCTVCGQSAWMAGGCRQISALSEIVSNAVALSESVAKQSADAHDSGVCGGQALCLRCATAASQQPVPALTIDSAVFRGLLDLFTAYRGMNRLNDIIRHIDTWAAELVQQRATLSDEQCHELRSTASINADLWAESQDFEPTQKQVSGVFIRTIITEAEAK